MSCAVAHALDAMLAGGVQEPETLLFFSVQSFDSGSWHIKYCCRDQPVEPIDCFAFGSDLAADRKWLRVTAVTTAMAATTLEFLNVDGSVMFAE